MHTWRCIVTTAKTLGLTAAIAGAFALGVWTGPSVWNRDVRPADAPVADAAAPSTPAVEKAPPPVLRREAAARKLPASTPALHDRLAPVLNRGTKMEVAAEGFRSAEQFATVAHAAHNTKVPFVVLKHRVLEEGKTLSAAIREYKPDVDAAFEVRRAEIAARADVLALES